MQFLFSTQLVHNLGKINACDPYAEEAGAFAYAQALSGPGGISSLLAFLISLAVLAGVLWLRMGRASGGGLAGAQSPRGMPPAGGGPSPAEEVVRGADDMIYYLSLSGWKMTLLNDAAARITGYSMEELGRDQRIWRDIVHPDDLAATQEFHRAHKEGVERHEEEYRLRTRDGRWKWMHSHMFASRGDDGRIAGYYCIDRDITRQKQAEEGQRSQETQLRSAYENAALGLMLATPEGIVISANNAMARLLGYGGAVDIEQRAFCDIMCHEGCAEVSAAMQALTHGGETSRELRIAIPRGDGKRRWLSLTLSPVFGEDGTVTSLAGLAVDVTEQRRSETLLVMLRDLGLAMGTCDTAAQALGAALDAALTLDPLDSGCAYTAKDGGLQLAEHRGLSEDYVQAAGEIPADSPSIARISKGHSLKLARAEIAAPAQEVLEREGISGAIVVPIMREGALLAALAVATHRELDIPASTHQAVMSIAQHVGAVIERMHAQAAYRDTQARIEALVRSVGDMVYFQERDGSFHMLNEAHLRITGFSRQDFEERQHIWREIVHPDDLRNADRMVARYPNGAGSLEIPYRLRTKMGEWRWMQSRMVGAYDAEGAFRGYYCVDRDITRMKRIEQALRDAEQRHSDIIDFLPDPTLVIDREHRVMAWNKAMERLTGVKAESVIWHGDYEHALPFFGERRPMLVDLAEESADRVLEVFPEARRTEDSWECELSPPALEGGNRYIIMSARVLSDTSGQRAGAIGSIRDITEIRLAEKALRHSEDTLRLLLNSVRDAIFVLDEAGALVRVNTSTFEMFGLDPSIAGKQLNMRHFLARGPAEEERFDDLLAEGGRAGAPLEFLAKRMDNDLEFPVEVVANRITVDGEPQLLLTLRDISERKRAEEEHKRLERQLLQAQKLESLGVLAGGIAHDFNNLLMGILGNASMASMDVEEGHPAAVNLRHIETAAQRAADVTQQLLAYSGQGRFVVEPVSLTDLSHDMLDLLRISISKRAKLNIETVDALPAVMADATQIRQVIMNLVTNASDALGDTDGSITVRTGIRNLSEDDVSELYAPPQEGPGAYAFFEVEDTGSGIDMEHLQRIFDPFFTTKFAGRGLGLAAVLGIVQGHKGGLHVQSTPGAGSIFRVLFPVTHEPAPARKERERTDETWQGSGTVLLADDEDAVRNAGVRMLERAGYNVIAVEDGQAAVDVFRERPQEILLAVLDVTMPHMDGKEAMAIIREARPDLPILLTSGYNQEEILEGTNRGGPVSFLQKPFRWSDLIEHIRGIQPLRGDAQAEEPQE